MKLKERVIVIVNRYEFLYDMFPTRLLAWAITNNY